MKELLDSILSDGFTPLSAVILAGIAVLILFSINTIKSFIKNRRPSPHVQPAKCPDCGWKGSVSRYAGRCPQCNQPLGDQKARPKA